MGEGARRADEGSGSQHNDYAASLSLAALGEDRKSVAISVTLQPKDKTLTDEEIEKVGASVVAAVTKATGATLRS